MHARHDGDSQAGFSLVELVVAMVITLIISGAIFGLMASGQNSFRREPELSDRQQNIRAGMNVVLQDIAIAGSGLRPNVQVFSQGLDGAGGLGLAGNTDYLLLMGVEPNCPTIRIAAAPAPTSTTLTMAEDLPECYAGPGNNNLLLVTYANGIARWGRATGVRTSAADRDMVFAATQPATPPAMINCAGSCPPGSGALDGSDFVPSAVAQTVAVFRIMAYRVFNGPDGVPSLWRSDTGGIDLSGTVQTAPPGVAWQLVARGIEDLQLQYRADTAVWSDQPVAVVDANLNTLTRQVRVTLSARSEAPLLQGQTTSVNLGNRVRGQLTSVAVPRVALTHLGQAVMSPAPPMWN